MFASDANATFNALYLVRRLTIESGAVMNFEPAATDTLPVAIRNEYGSGHIVREAPPVVRLKPDPARRG